MNRNSIVGSKISKFFGGMFSMSVQKHPNNDGRSPLPSRRELIERHSKARVLVASNKQFVKEWGTDEKGRPMPKVMSRPLHDSDVRASLARKLGAR